MAEVDKCDAPKRRKLVIVGDGACGKTSLLSVFTLGYFPKQPTVFENYVSVCRVDGEVVELSLWDTAGQEDYEKIRFLSYNKAHVILVAYAVNVPDSLDNVHGKWTEEIGNLCPNVPIILVGLKSDLRTDPQELEEMSRKYKRFVDHNESATVARQIGAVKSFECSSLTGANVDNVFEAAIRAALVTPHNRSITNNLHCCSVT